MAQKTLENLDELKEICRQVRVSIIKMLTEAGSGHPGGSLSAVEILVTLFWTKMRHDPRRPHWPERDRFVLSKGHGVPALYAVLAHQGYFPREELMTLRKLESRLQGHPDRCRLPGLETSTGALGQGLSIAQGMALASRLDGSKWHVYCLVGDGESQEGQIWECAMSAPRFKIDTLTAILDYNRGQLDGAIKEIMDIEPVAEKWRAFNWHVIEVDGHDIAQIKAALDEAGTVKGRPTMIVAHTVKGKGVSFMENVWKWHGVTPTREECEKALAELAP